MRVRRALLSVSDKTGLEDLARRLVELGVTIISTGGTAEALRGWGVDVVQVDEVTGHPEILGGRVKTLHPKVHGGILGRTDLESDVRQMQENGIEPIDLVVVNLYPFEETVARRGAGDDEIVEQIDIGGPALIRAAAKNHVRVAVVTSPAQYPEILAELDAGDGELSTDLLRRLAGAAYQRTARYDAAIADYFASREDDFPEAILMGFDKHLEVSYGENPHQRGAYYTERGARTHLLALTEQLHGKALSFNNLLDLDAARGLLAEFELPACVIVKHNNPCGVAVAGDVGSAYVRARNCDPVSAYGGVIVVNRQVDGALGELLAGTFVEVLLAPGYDDDALAALTRKPNTRIMLTTERRRANPGERNLRRVTGGMLIQDRDDETEVRDHMTVVTKRVPSEAEWGDLLFAWRVAKHVKSNAIVLARDLATVGVGAGQMSRVDSVRLSLEKAQVPVDGSVLASDAFFPFADGPEAAIAAGVKAVIQPGGSIRDDEVFAACDAADVSMVVTGRRHFRESHTKPRVGALVPRWERTIDVDAPASATWDLVGDPTSVPRWYPKYETADVAGGQRILRNADGGELVETLDDRDDDARRYSYTVVSGAPVASYHASFEVQEREGGSRVVWTVEAEPVDPSVDLEARLTPTQEDALRRIKEIVESEG